jgi:hypothetical protein
MTTSGTTTFDLSIDDLIEEAFERCGIRGTNGYQLKSARRSLNLLFLDWANRGLNLWTIEQGQIAMNQGQIVYNLPVDTIDLLDMVVRTQTGINQTDININRISSSTYSTIPNKNAQGRPIQVWINRQSGAEYPDGLLPPGVEVKYPTINVWPCPDQSDYYTFVYWRLRRIQDAGNGVNTQDIPFRMLPALVSGLAYYLSLKLKGAEPRIDMLKMAYMEQWDLASSEDREKAALRITPRQYFR